MKVRSLFVGVAIIVALFILATWLVTAYNPPRQLKDLEGLTQTNPDKVRLVINADRFPNVVAVCIEGQGFVSTTRHEVALIPVPAWGEPGGWCSTQ